MDALEKEISKCKDILSVDTESTDAKEQISKATKCIKLLKSYSEKVENQSEKYIVALPDGSEDIEAILDEESTICDKASECCVELEQHIEELTVLQRKKIRLESRHCPGVTDRRAGRLRSTFCFTEDLFGIRK